MKNRILSALLVCGSMLQASPITWSSPPDQLSTNGMNAQNPSVVIDTSGNSVAIWVEQGIATASSHPLGGSWGTPVPLSNTGAASPAITMDPFGNATAVWRQGNRVRSSTLPAGGSWSPEETLSMAGGARQQVAAEANGDVTACWTRNGNIETLTRPFGGAWPGSPTSITSTMARLPQLAVGGTSPNDAAIIVWHRMKTVRNGVYASERISPGVWSAELEISDPQRASAFASVSVDGMGNAIATWFSYDEDNGVFSNVQLNSAYKPFQQPWQAPRVVGPGGDRDPADLFNQVALNPQGDALAIWSSSPRGNFFNTNVATRLFGEDWSDNTEALTIRDIYSYAASISTDSFGNGFAAFMFGLGSDVVVEPACTFLSSFKQNFWSFSTPISAGSNNGFPDIAATLTGGLTNNATAIWEHYDGANTVIQAATGTGTILDPPSNGMVMQVENNRGIFIEYTNVISWDPSPSLFVNNYLIYRNGQFVRSVSAAVLQFVDPNQILAAPVTYEIRAVTEEGFQSAPLIVPFP